MVPGVPGVPSQAYRIGTSSSFCAPYMLEHAGLRASIGAGLRAPGQTAGTSRSCMGRCPVLSLINIDDKNLVYFFLSSTTSLCCLVGLIRLPADIENSTWCLCLDSLIIVVQAFRQAASCPRARNHRYIPQPLSAHNLTSQPPCL